MQERILVPLDGSRVGEAALQMLRNVIKLFSKEVQVEVTLLQVITSLSHYVVAGEASVQVLYTNEELNQIKKAALDYLQKAGEFLKDLGVTLNYKVVTGNAADEILKTADEINATLIAMSTHGRSGISRWALGSVTDRVLRGSTRPILVVRASK